MTEQSISELPPQQAGAQNTEPSDQRIEKADLLVGVLAELAPEALAALCAELRTLVGAPRVVVLRRGNGAEGAHTAPAPVTPELTAPAEDEATVTVVPWSQLDAELRGTLLQSISAAYESIFAAGEKMEARACCVVASHLEPAAPRWIREVAEPLLDGRFDLVTPCYSHRPLEGLLNSAVIAPLLRSLYGRRLQNPMGPDLGVSRKLLEKMIGAGENGNAARRMHPLASLAAAAACGNLPGCQVHLGSRSYPPPDWTNMSSLIAQALGPVFQDMERNAAHWQRIRGSSPVQSTGCPTLAPQESGGVDIGAMVNSFQLGVRDLQEIWRLVLPPSTLLGIGKLARATPEQFHLPDDLWVRILYDFALGHRLRTINRDHLLRSLTPLFMGWVGSFAREIEGAEPGATEQRLERLSLAFEGNKSYLVSRWRWPDRFNP